MNETEQLKARIKKLEEQLQVLTDKVVFNKDIVMQDGRDIRFAKGTGTKIGTETTQKLAFYGGTPVVQFSTAFNSTAGATYGTIEQNMINALKDALIYYNLAHS